MPRSFAIPGAIAFLRLDSGIPVRLRPGVDDALQLCAISFHDLFEASGISSEVRGSDPAFLEIVPFAFVFGVRNGRVFRWRQSKCLSFGSVRTVVAATRDEQKPAGDGFTEVGGAMSSSEGRLRRAVVARGMRAIGVFTYGERAPKRA